VRADDFDLRENRVRSLVACRGGGIADQKDDGGGVMRGVASVCLHPRDEQVARVGAVGDRDDVCDRQRLYAARLVTEPASPRQCRRKSDLERGSAFPREKLADLARTPHDRRAVHSRRRPRFRGT